MKFQTLDLPDNLKQALAEAGYIDAMPVQEKVIELGLAGRDLYVQSQTGTGKTAAFLLVVFYRLLTDPQLKGRKALIMVPTRELAVQVEEEANVIGRYLPFKTGSFYGGVGYSEQQKMLRNDTQILIGTPGRVLDLNASGQMNLMDIAFLVLDEADRMFDMGFYPDLRKLIKVISPPERRQTMLFSATLNVYVKNLAAEYTKDPLEIEIEPEHITVEEIEQIVYHVPSEKKFSLLLGIIQREKPESAIVFCNTKRYTEIVARRLRANGIICEYLSGDLPQKKRLELIDGLKAGRYHYLAATDVAARGIDIAALALVVNYDLPSETENYVHRIGRTARAGADGRAISFASEQDVYDLVGIEKYIGKKIPSEIAGEELYAEDKSGFTRSRETSRSGHGARREHGGARRNNGEGASRKKTSRGEAHGHVKEEKQNTQKGSHGKLEGMPFEDRMRYYKEQYNENNVASSGKSGNTSSRKRRRRGGREKLPGVRTDGIEAGAKTGTRQTGKKSSGAEKGIQNQKADKGRDRHTRNNVAPPKNEKKTSQGLFARLATLLGGKKK